MIGDRDSEIKGEQGTDEGQLSPAKHLKRPKGESTRVATLRLAQTRVCKLQSKVLTYH